MSFRHYEQSYENSCVPACMCMIQLWRGEEPTETAFHEGADPPGHPIRHVHALPRTAPLQSAASSEDIAIGLALRQGRCVVVLVCGPRYVGWLKEHYPVVTSKHGELCPPGTWGAPLHALLLIARRDDGFEFYDPWFPGQQQPFRMSEDAFQECFAGYAVVALP